jgi:hypothetical protein
VPSDADEPVLILANGKRVMPDGRVINEVVVPKPAAQFTTEVQSGRAATRTLAKMHRKLSDLPDLPQKMNPIAAILAYSAIGLSDADIATALGASEEQVKVLKASELFTQLNEMFDRTVFEDARRNARHIVANASNKAAERMVAAIDSTDESVAVVASREIMKTAGISLEEENKRSLSGLKIVIERAGSEKNDKITVSMNGE